MRFHDCGGEMKPTMYEKDDVSKFRKFIREKRFSQPKYEDQLKSLYERVELNTAPPIALIIAKSLQKESPIPVDNVGIGKTDFSYYASSFFRQISPKINVLAFPDIFDEVARGSTFYDSIFVPEVIKLTQTNWDKLKNLGKIISILFTLVGKKIVLLLTVNAILVITVITFIIGAIGAWSLSDLIAHQSKLMATISEIASPIVVLTAVLAWILMVSDKISKDKSYSQRWKDSSFARLKQLATIENPYTSPTQLAKRFNPKEKTIIIVDDANRIDPLSIKALIELVSPVKLNNNENHHHLGLLLLCDDLKVDDIHAEQESTYQQLSEHGGDVKHWLRFNLLPPTLDELEWLLWGAYESGKAWNLIEQLVARFPTLENNTGFLLQFLYDQTTILEHKRKSLIDLGIDELINDYQIFLDDYDLQAERILARIPSENTESGRELIKYILAFESPLMNADKVHLLMEGDGHLNPKQIAETLTQKKLIKLIDGSYAFNKPAEKNTLSLNWSDWQESSSQYYSKVLNILHEFSSAADNPILAKRCEPSNLVVDILWREGDALWFYGGNSDILNALSYYGLGTGALGKWVQIFEENLRNGSLSSDIYYWHVRARNSPFRYKKTSRSVRSESYIGDLLQVSASLYFTAGDYDKASYILSELWNQIRDAYWGMSDLDERIITKIVESDQKIKLQLSTYLLFGLAKKGNIDDARKFLESINRDKVSVDAILQIQALLWRIEYFSSYAIGNSLSSLSLIRDIRINEASTQQDKGKSLLASLFIVPIRLSHLCDYAYWVRNQSEGHIDLSSVIQSIKTLLVQFEDNLRLFQKHVDDSGKKPYPLIKDMLYPIADAEIFILMLKGWLQYFKGKELFFEFVPLTEKRTIPYKLDEIGSAIRSYYGASEKIWEGTVARKIGSDELLDARKLCAGVYSKYVTSDNLKRDEFQKLYYEIEKATNDLFSCSQAACLDEASRLFGLVSDVSSIRLGMHDELLAIYAQVGLLLQLVSIDQTSKKQKYNEHLSELLRRIESNPRPHIQGNMMDSLRFHTQIAQAYGDFYFEHAYKHFDAARLICDSLEGYLPSILKGQILGRQLNLHGNMGAFVQPDQILHLANQALKIYNDYSGEAISLDDLEIYKGSTRWWIAEACSRLAHDDIKNIDTYHKTAEQHFNWIERQSKDNPALAKEYLPKNKQVQAAFSTLQKDYRKAINLLQNALPDFDDNLFEQIQTLQSLVSYYLLYFRTEGNKIDKKFGERFSGHLYNLRARLLQSRSIHQSKKQFDILYRKTSEACITYGKTIWDTSAREQNELAQEAVDLWFFGISGLVEWKLAGRAAMELSIAKGINEREHSFILPVEFESLVKRCVAEWDPRRELTDKTNVEKALSHLTGKNVQVSDVLLEGASKFELISRCHMLLARPTPDILGVYETLVGTLSLIQEDDPISEDIDLVRLLIECSSVEKDYEKVRDYNELFKRISNTYASKVYLGVAEAFFESPEIQERYLRMAAAMRQNKYSDEANRKISDLVNKTGVRKPDLTKDELEKINFARLIKLSDNKYNISESFNLLFLFENELRRLIAFQFNKREGWWKNGIPNDLYERVNKENKDSKERIKGIELLKLLTLGDLFKIIKYLGNWEPIFKPVFLAINYIESREAIILPFRNKLAHTNPDIAQSEMKEFVAVTKHMITRMQPYLPE